MLRFSSFLRCLAFATTAVFCTSGWLHAQDYRTRSRSKTPREAKQAAEAAMPVGQDYLKGRYLTVGLQLGAVQYRGDLAPRLFASAKKPLWGSTSGLQVTKRVHPYVTLRADLSWARLRGDDYFKANPFDAEERRRYLRNANFRNSLKELAVTAAIDVLPVDDWLMRPLLMPYALIGVGVFHHNPRVWLDGEWVNAAPLGTEGQHADNAAEKGYPTPYKRVQVSVPLGLGVRYRLTPQLELSGEATYRFTTTDYLDDVSGTFADPRDLSPEARRLVNRSAARSASGASRGLATLLGNDQQIQQMTLDGETYDYVPTFFQRGNARGTTSGNDGYVAFLIRLSYVLFSD
ncbi:hypothetical protein SAMN05421823_101295 [Catalinimonas alkaloidigena]|uniref:Uncharacterized protein n=1 Tax=Catalinimonas alkaloidigena TaxID=1075417 RepID=A0A1G8XAQ9_9BACT|nr:DUF6089 family protein [Catalinimonas alkaloidigena]SDJ86820.1 hypothetical protein SAMN05421823_101295 [Catalinimonas alkaloidigena]